MKKVVLVIPTLNEEENIGKLIESVLAVAKTIPAYDFHVLVSDSHSKDKTKEIVLNKAGKSPQIHFLDVEKKGLGLALKRGFDYAAKKLNADIIGQIDGDLSHNPKDIPALLSKIEKGNDISVGSRLMRGGQNLLEPHRRVFSFGASLMIRFLVGIKGVTEFTTSYRFFNKEVFQKLMKEKLIERDDWTFLPVFLVEAALLDYKIGEVPIVFTDRKLGKSKMNTPRFIVSLIRYSSKSRLKRSGKFFKFLTVGFIGLVINTVGLRVLVESFNVHPAVSNLISAEIAIISNYFWNNLWTFKEHKITQPLKFVYKLLVFNLTSVVGVILIQTAAIYIGVALWGKSLYMIYFAIGTGLLLIWNFTVYNKIIWKTNKTV